MATVLRLGHIPPPPVSESTLVIVPVAKVSRLTAQAVSRSGALIAGVMPGSPADQAGLAAGDDIVSADAATVNSPTTLTTLLTAHHPGDTMRLTWIDVLGQRHTATLRLTTGPPN